MKTFQPLAALSIMALAGSAGASPIAQPTSPTAEGAAVTSDSLSRAVGGSSSSATVRGWFTMPDDMSVVTASVSFMTADDMLGDKVKFTDIVFASLAASHALTDRLELHAGGTFLLKQTSLMDEYIFQSGALSALFATSERTGIALGGSGGLMMNDLGSWYSSDALFRARPEIDKHLYFDISAGASYSALKFDDAHETYGFSEFGTGIDIVFWGGNRRRTEGGALWVGTNFAFPLFDTDGPQSTVRLSPQTRANFHIGASVTLNKWNLFTKFSVIDRGDAQRPETQLPILSGGFDQQQFVIGISREFEDKDDDRMHRVASR